MWSLAASALLALMLRPQCLLCADLKNVTGSVFVEGDLDILPLAFGDFNSDKLTDLIVLHSGDRSKLSILLAQPQTFSLASDKYFSGLSEARDRHLTCTFEERDVLGVAPADFDGDGGMDLAVSLREIGKKDHDRVEVMILWGDHDQETDQHRLVCQAKAEREKVLLTLEMEAEPLVMDANGDNVADLYSQTNGTRGIWVFAKEDRHEKPYYSTLEGNVTEPFRFPHSNAFVDLNADGNADLFVTGERAFHLWKDVGSHSAVHFEKHLSVEYPKCGQSGGQCSVVGQSAFADFDLDGKLDTIFPACAQADCGGGEEGQFLYFATTKVLWGEDKPQFERVPVIAEGWRFHPDGVADGGVYDSSSGNIYFGLTPRVGDINLDGYPDMIIRMENEETGKIQMQVLLNLFDPSTKKLSFLLQQEIMEGITDTSLAVFYDLYENGMEDMLVVQKKPGRDKFEIGAYTNETRLSDAYFVKVIVLTGACYHDCPDNLIWVPYGTNMPGQTVCYRTQRPQEETFVDVAACAAQLPQTAHHALQLPYTIFGLGMSPNFLDFMYVNVTNATGRSEGRSWPQIIPNSQVYVIPHPTDDPSQWEAKLFITPSRGITLTGFALVGACGVCSVIILFFHWRERQEDRREKMQQPNQFHFDAM